MVICPNCKTIIEEHIALRFRSFKLVNGIPYNKMYEVVYCPMCEKEFETGYIKEL